MGVRILAYRIGLFALLRELQYTLSQLSQDALTAVHLAIFEALRTEWMQILLAEIGILDELSQAHAAVHKADRALDLFAGRVSRAVDEHTDGKTRKQLRLALFKRKTLSRFRRPVLSSQLLAMLDWNDTLARCGVPALIALAKEAETLVAAGQEAKDKRDKAEQKNRDFREVGTRKQFIDKVNAERKDVHGRLSKLPFQNPALPQDFAEAFFLSEPPRDEEETIDEVKTSIGDLKTQLEEREALLKKLEEEAAAEAKAEEERKEQEQEADDLEEQGKKLLKQAAALRAKPKK